MKASSVLVVLMLGLGPALAAGADVVVKGAPLTWRKAAISDGGALYQELCAVCHGESARGDGPAAPALKNTVPDLTMLAAKNGGEFPFQKVQETITGQNRVIEHGTVSMPIWGRAFEAVRPDWTRTQREAFAEQRIYNITEYLSTIQVQ